MSNMMIYAHKGAVGGNVENVWGYAMQVCTIDSSDEKAVAAAKANGYSDNPQDVIEEIKAKAMEAENKVMKGVLGSGRIGDTMNNPRITELEEQLSTALTEIAGFEQERADSDKVIDEKIARIAELELELAGVLTDNAKLESELKHAKAKLAIYEESKDANGDGVVSYDEMTKDELKVLLEQRNVDFVERDSKDALIQKLKDSEVKDAKVS